MKFTNRFKDRYNILVFVLIILLSILVLQLANLTIAQGDKYRNEADTKRLKEIPITAPRGEIRDRNGKLIAGNKLGFTIQISKDELDSSNIQERNENILRLVRLMEEDGISYVDDFPIELNVFKYASEEDYRKEETQALDKVINIIFDNNLLVEILNLNYTSPEYESHYRFSMMEKAMQSIRSKGIEVPIFRGSDGQLYYREDKDVLAWKSEHGINLNATPLDSIVFLMKNNSNIIKDLLNHGISRKLVYDKLKSKGLSSNIVLEEFSLQYDEQYKNQKRRLINQFSYVTESTTGEQDFINIFKENSLENFLLKPRIKKTFTGGEKLYAPGEDLVKMLRDIDRNYKFKVEIDEENNSVRYEYQGKSKGDMSDLEFLITESEKHGFIDKFLKKDEIRGLAQSQLLTDGINTRISIADGYEYTYLREKESLYKINNIDLGSTPKEAFYKFIEKNKIDKNLSRYEARAVMVVIDILKKQSHRAYEPVNIAYSIKDETVARVEEGMADVPGVGVSIEPVRYYPEGETAAHILGYLGRISQKHEIEKYIDELGYSPNDIIGKTGLEQSFEEYLRGKNGYKRVEVDVFGNTTKVLEEVKPIPGDNIYLSIDLDLQKKAEENLKNTLEAVRTGGTYQSQWGNYRMNRHRSGRPFLNAKSGATVATDVKTGDVLAMVSYPAYDPNLFSTGISSSDWESLFPENEKDQLAPRPLYNIATQTSVQPGSVYKMATALAGLEKGLSPYKTIRDMQYVKLGSDEFSCHIRSSGGSHGPVDVRRALEVSCNYYFYSLALGMNQRTGESLGMKVEIDDIIDISTQLGLNDKTGIEINIPNESSGGVPDPKLKAQATKNMLRNFLKRNLNNFTDDGRELSEEELDDIVEDIIAWADSEKVYTKNEVLTGLKELGINGEKKMPDGREDLADAIKYGYLNHVKWTMADTLNATIGQGHGEYTPIQMSNYVATLTNGGYNNKLTLINNIKNYNNSKITYEPDREAKKMDLNNPDNLNHIMDGMLRVSNTGTGRRTFSSFPVKVGSKTGTAEKDGKIPGTNMKYDNFGWFVAFGPYEDPQIAVATVLVQGGSGGNAGPMTRDIIGEYLGLNQEYVVDDSPFENRLTE